MPGSRWRWGQVRSSTGAALFEVDPATQGPSTTPLVSNNPDFTSLHEVRAWGVQCVSLRARWCCVVRRGQVRMRRGWAAVCGWGSGGQVEGCGHKPLHMFM